MTRKLTLMTGYARPALAILASAFIFSFLAAPLEAQAGHGTCAGNSANRELDFWLGEWNIASPGASTGTATSRVSLELDKCLVVESWSGGKDHTGKNMFGYSEEDRNWHGMFADNEGRVHLFEGKVFAGSAEFHGSSRGRNGETELHRIKISRLGPDKVEQTWEKSIDNGATWNKVFDGQYSRR